MKLLSIIFVAIGLSLDASAVSLVCGLNEMKRRYLLSLKLGTFFGIFQSVMFLIGYSVGVGFSIFISRFDHWVAFFLLILVGGKMVYEYFKREEKKCFNTDSFFVLISLSIATSIDALAVGISFALLSFDLLVTTLLIGIVTFFNSFIFTIFGKFFNRFINNRSELVGGLILIGIGIKILMEHTL
ncbi:MAG: manganese efflux pump MntP family protein [bacterium]|nr:manganese efflux pump MntP family protein [bacterium]